MVIDPTFLSALAVISSGCVAIVGILAPAVIAVVNDWLKWRRESRDVWGERIHTATAELLSGLAAVESADRMFDRTQEPGIERRQKVYSEMLGRYYAWEHIVWARLNQEQRDRLQEVRQTFEVRKGRTYAELAAIVLDLARSAQGW